MSDTKYKTIKELGYKTLDKVTSLKNIITAPSDVQFDFNIAEISGVDDSFDYFWDKIKNNYEFMVERDASYLRWRYFDKRGGSYIIKKASSGDEFLGYIVIRINNYVKEYPSGYIMDLLTIPGRLDVAYALIQDAYDYFLKSNVNITNFLVIKGHPYETLLSNNNYVRLSSYTLLHGIHDIAGELDSFLNAPASKLHFSYGDTDWI